MKITKPDKDVIIVGAGLAGLSCARRLMKDNVSFLPWRQTKALGGG